MIRVMAMWEDGSLSVCGVRSQLCDAAQCALAALDAGAVGTYMVDCHGGCSL